VSASDYSIVDCVYSRDNEQLRSELDRKTMCDRLEKAHQRRNTWQSEGYVQVKYKDSKSIYIIPKTASSLINQAEQ